MEMVQGSLCELYTLCEDGAIPKKDSPPQGRQSPPQGRLRLLVSHAIQPTTRWCNKRSSNRLYTLTLMATRPSELLHVRGSVNRSRVDQPATQGGRAFEILPDQAQPQTKKQTFVVNRGNPIDGLRWMRDTEMRIQLACQKVL